jgi:DNA-binding Xre family transcriptional regulator
MASVVETKGLSRESDNGQVGQVLNYDQAKNRVVVQLLDEECRHLSVKPENLIPFDEAS